LKNSGPAGSDLAGLDCVKLKACMSNAVAILALLSAAALPKGQEGPVRMGLFSLFKPEVIHLRVGPGEGATLGEAGGPLAARLLPGDSVRARLAGNQVSVVVTDSYGRVRKSLTAPEARITPAGATAFELSLPGKIERAVRGELRIAAQAGARGRLQVVLTTDYSAAVASVVAAEMGGRREVEAVKALAIVVRTFMLSHANRHGAEGFDFCDTTHCQLYRGEADLAAEARSPIAASAVAETRGQVLSFAGRAIEGYYTAVCGGMTATPEMAWGGATGGNYRYTRVECEWCRASRYWRWERKARAASVLDALAASAGARLSQSAEVLVEKSEPDGFVHSVAIVDKGRRTVISADEFRRRLGRRLGWSTVLSPSFTIERRGQAFYFRGRGFGSQVGFCMVGAVAQAAAGRSHSEILEFYYPRAEIKGRQARGEGRE
jgi:stage II sporulation protein D